MALKQIKDISQKLENHYRRIWAQEVVDEGSSGWPYQVTVGKPSRSELESAWASISAEAGLLSEWAPEHGFACVYEQRLVGRVSYRLLTHIQAGDIHKLAAAIGCEKHFDKYCTWCKVLQEKFPACSSEDIRTVLAALDRTQADDTDFDLVQRAALWFAGHEYYGMTPREVPLEGFHAKWLDSNSHRNMVCKLAGLDTLELKERPRLVQFHYLDPVYIASAERIFDSWLEGDKSSLPYTPKTVVICENRDTALWFKPIDKGIAVLGDGLAGTALLPYIAWIGEAERLFYWGDIDIRGFEILAAYRQRGLKNIQSLLMDTQTYEAYRQYGTKLVEIDLEVLDHITGGVLTEEDKADCWEKAKRLKMVMPLEDFMNLAPDSEVKDYICSIWDDVEVPFTLWG